MPTIFPAHLKKYRFLQLVVLLMVLLLLVPVLMQHKIMGALTEMVMLDSLVVAAGASTLGRRMRWPLLVTWALAFGSFAVGYIFLPPAAAQMAFVLCSFLYTFFSFGCTVAVLSFVAENRRGVTLDALLASVAAYVLLAISFSCLYSLLVMLNPQSFHPPTLLNYQHPAHIYLTMIYFSLVTLTTVGYGDIAPISGFAQMFAGMEALIGQLYLAILVAYLVGSSLSARLLRDRETPAPAKTIP
ncbi:MAG: potassium channel family protein [Proteobacteria bacterium]|nr:potassium channel family protein [Pseudomonadota bacterium]MBU4381547.1 potassium channel family protein [Pseudomonadota bacterium]MBU4603964.1 potassium channel family protein [Pseudomonadota bacterium]MCG2766534.1 potassium channel family protein [Desulfarculaceae bacterium]